MVRIEVNIYDSHQAAKAQVRNGIIKIETTTIFFPQIWSVHSFIMIDATCIFDE